MASNVIKLKNIYPILLVMTLIVLLFVISINTKADQKNEANEVKILSPKNGDEVGSKIVVKGTSKVKDGSSVWVLAHLRLLTDQWWPQPKPLVQPNGDWEALAYIGQPDDVGFDFEIAVATFDKVDRQLTSGKPKWQTAPPVLVAPYYGVDEGGKRAGFKSEFVSRIRRCDYPQFMWDKLPIRGNTIESILRLDIRY
jgi:hypothetical protein